MAAGPIDASARGTFFKMLMGLPYIIGDTSRNLRFGHGFEQVVATAATAQGHQIDGPDF